MPYKLSPLSHAMQTPPSAMPLCARLACWSGQYPACVMHLLISCLCTMQIEERKQTQQQMLEKLRKLTNAGVSAPGHAILLT